MVNLTISNVYMQFLLSLKIIVTLQKLSADNSGCKLNPPQFFAGICAERFANLTTNLKTEDPVYNP